MAARKKKATRKAAPARKKKARKKKKRATRRANANQSNTHGITAPTSRQMLESNERAIAIVRMRQEQGATMRQIAAKLDVSTATVHYWLHQAAAMFKSEYLEAWEEMRATRTHQLDQLIAENFARALAGDKDSGSIVLRSISELNRMHSQYPDAKGGASPGSDGDNPFDGISENERARVLVELLDQAGDDALELIGIAIDRKRASQGRPPIQGKAVREKNSR